MLTFAVVGDDLQADQFAWRLQRSGMAEALCLGPRGVDEPAPELLKQLDRVQAAVLLLAPTKLPKWIEALASRRKPLMVPPVFATDLRQARRCRDVVLQHGIVCHVAYSWRFLRVLWRLTREIRKDGIVAMAGRLEEPGEQPPDIRLGRCVDALDLMACIAGGFTHVAALGTTAPQVADADKAVAYAITAHGQTRVVCQHLSVRSAVTESASLTLFTTDGPYELDLLGDTMRRPDGSDYTPTREDLDMLALQSVAQFATALRRVEEDEPTGTVDLVPPMVVCDIRQGFERLAVALAALSSSTTGLQTAVPLQ